VPLGVLDIRLYSQPKSMGLRVPRPPAAAANPPGVAHGRQPRRYPQPSDSVR
jgi:hypothetical protein